VSKRLDELEILYENQLRNMKYLKVDYNEFVHNFNHLSVVVQDMLEQVKGICSDLGRVEFKAAVNRGTLLDCSDGPSVTDAMKKVERRLRGESDA